LELLRFAVDALAAYPRVFSYLDAGHGAWTAPAAMARRLRDADIHKVRGFSINVSFYDTTAAEITYGKTVSDLAGHKPFVIDTSRNGRGRTPGASGWCNPAGRALGPTPLTAPGDGRVDALLWIKTPGVSDGDCGRGEPVQDSSGPNERWNSQPPLAGELAHQTQLLPHLTPRSAQASIAPAINSGVPDAIPRWEL
jgi:endoglucanase